MGLDGTRLKIWADPDTGTENLIFGKMLEFLKNPSKSRYFYGFLRDFFSMSGFFCKEKKDVCQGVGRNVRFAGDLLTFPVALVFLVVGISISLWDFVFFLEDFQ